MSEPIPGDAEWRDGFPSSKIDPKVALLRFRQLEKENGGVVTPDVIVRDAKKKTSPFHSAFQWDDKVAAAEHRLATARTLIGALRVLVKTESGDLTPRRVYVHTENAGGYQRLEVAVRDPDSREELLRRAISDMQSFRARYAELAEVAGVIAAIDDVETLVHA